MLLFPYLEGEQFVGILRGLGGWRAVNRVYRGRRPQSAEQVLHPDKYVSDERPVRLAPIALGATLGRAWHRVTAASVSELDLRALVDEGPGTPNVRAAEGWGGGLFELWQTGPAGGCEAPCIARDVGLMHLNWDTPYDRGEAEPVLRRVLRRKLDAERAGGGPGVSLWRSRGGAIGIAGRGQNTFLASRRRSRWRRRCSVARSPEANSEEGRGGNR